MVNEVEQIHGLASDPVRLEVAMGPAVLVREDASLREVANLMLERQVSSVVVVDAAGAVRGVVSDCDLTLNQRYLRLSAIKAPRVHGRWVTPSDEVEAACLAATSTTAEEVMDSRMTTATVVEPIGAVVDRMLRRESEYALVLRDGDVVGLLGRRDLLRLVAGQPQSHPVSVAKNNTIQQPTANVAAYVSRPVLRWLSGWLKPVWILSVPRFSKATPTN